MDIHDFAKAGAMFIKPEEVKNNPQAVFVIITEGEIRENKFKNQILHIEGEFNKERKSMEDLKRLNKRFEELIKEVKKKSKVTSEAEALSYFFFMEGFAEGAGMTQLAV